MPTSWFLAAALVLLGAPAVAGEEAERRPRAGLEAYFRGDIGESAVALKRALREEARRDDADSGMTAYFLGRAFHELGLRGLALHYFGQAEKLGATEWRRFARREIARIYYRAAEYPAVVEVFRRLPAEDQDGEVLYLAGIAAAMLQSWDEAQEILRRVRPSDPLRPYAVYVRSQARAAAGDATGALADLGEVISPARAAPGALRDQARILSGKMLYVEGRESEARAAFGSAEKDGPAAFDAMRGLWLTGAGEEAAEVSVSESRPTDVAALLAIRAVVAEQREDGARAMDLRRQVKGLVAKRLRTLEHLRAGGPAAAEALDRELAEFAALLRRARWASLAREERALLPRDLADSAAVANRSAIRDFRPSQGEFYAVWNEARVNPWLRGLIEMLSASEALSKDLRDAAREKPFWRFWRREEEDPLPLALLELRSTNLRQLLEDHLHTYRAASGEELQAAKQRSIEETNRELERLYLGPEAKTPPLLSNLRLTLEYKRSDMSRLVASVPERSTDPVISLLGNTVDLLGELRLGLARSGGRIRAVERSGLLEGLARRNGALQADLREHIYRAILPTLRRQTAFHTRLEADNEGSLSRLYARMQAAGEGGR